MMQGKSRSVVKIAGLAAFVVPILVLTGCAGSASHEVIAKYQANDGELSCDQIDVELVKAQFVIDGVTKDKEDISGADVVDTILWFPFNLIAKSSNYSDAVKAASDRIARLEKLRMDRVCLKVASSKSDKLKSESVAQDRELSGTEIISVYSDTTVDVFRSENADSISSDNTIIYHADGVMLGSTKAGNGDQGQWWVKDNQLCRQWIQWQNAEEKCYTIMLRGNRVRWIQTNAGSDKIHRLRRIPNI